MAENRLPQQLKLDISIDGKDFETTSVPMESFSQAVRSLAKTYPYLRLPPEHTDKAYTLLLSTMIIDEGYRFGGNGTYVRI